MNKEFCASSLVLTLAAGLGYWLINDSMPPRKSREAKSSIAEAVSLPKAQDQTIIAGDRDRVEFIDLSRVFEPTGDELDLETLLAGVQETEILGMPRPAKSSPIDDAAEEASSLPNTLEMLKARALCFIAAKLAEVTSRLQPLMGSQGALPIEKPGEPEPLKQ